MSTQNPNPNPYPSYAMPAPAPSKPFYRPSDGRMIGGVCAAVADRFGWDRNIVRLATVASIFLPGPQVLAYVAAWIIIPDEQKFWERQATAQQAPAYQPYPAPPAPPQA
ncbi:phage shock protein C, PspC [Xylanimonas cellulosilytica DSM 15894]|uniref:Phage shock protein C, PspC n=1 Tax=Xylanimonas cellulosilytica (strain DSM 15894 / JCM 12276 / CECT 5975 / KCTC 9989 / LMG 20990 / NBRC 107835 / XIL07) TaxID=446471 RepID=D1BTF9_XYLCX|nr:PspC domain-containing protein [Xylanimonas cellulosilytica]ACZ29101.1 phage shock protein C, PspC [Xylanimonas cellulosilytica DSM 15894]